MLRQETGVWEEREREMDCFITERSNGCVLIALSRDSDFMFKTTLILIRMGEGVQRDQHLAITSKDTQVHRERGEIRRRGETQEERSRWGQERSEGSLLKGVIMWGIFWGKRVQCSMKTFCNCFITSNIFHSGKKSVCSETNLLKWFIWTSKNFLSSRTWIISKWPLTFNTYEKLRNLNWKSFVTK